MMDVLTFVFHLLGNLLIVLVALALFPLFTYICAGGACTRYRIRDKGARRVVFIVFAVVGLVGDVGVLLMLMPSSGLAGLLDFIVPEWP